MSLPSTRPYVLRAIFEWCVDNGFTPHLTVAVDAHTVVPREYVADGQITLNIGAEATQRLSMQNDFVSFVARFNGAARDIFIPVGRIVAIYARENGAGLVFPPEDSPIADPAAPATDAEVVRADEADAADKPADRGPDKPPRGKSHLQRVK